MHRIAMGVTAFVVLFSVHAASVLFQDAAYAYIDPGTGKVIYTSIAAIIATGAGVFGAIFWPLRRLIRRIKRRSSQSESSD
jgi:hypothetical protein